MRNRKDVYLNLSIIVVGEIKYNNQPVGCPPNQSRYYKNLDRIHVKIILGMFYQDDVIAGIFLNLLRKRQCAGNA